MAIETVDMDVDMAVRVAVSKAVGKAVCEAIGIAVARCAVCGRAAGDRCGSTAVAVAVVCTEARACACAGRCCADVDGRARRECALANGYCRRRAVLGGVDKDAAALITAAFEACAQALGT